ncbi:cwf19-like protein [Niveomyces insectorum RCEF 264]|uniref:Cwf19-like protein n=1 Tax=Niveomyces insectorum RCEF 264 TaxID=1081102 RepID=A0A167Z5L5_9HYPO|nr:cwf19-like protein [Niveomyces insectorum RCEF 264]
MQDSLKIIVLGPVNGRLEAAFAKLAALHAKNNFSCAIATGDLFHDESADAEGSGGLGAAAADDQLAKLLAGDLVVPVPTYFTAGTRPFPRRVAAKLAALHEEEAAAAAADAEAQAQKGGQNEHETADAGADPDSGGTICPNLYYLGTRSVTRTVDGLRIVALGGRLDAGGTGVARAELSREDGVVPLHTPADVRTAQWPRGVWRGSRVALPEGLLARDANDANADAAASSASFANDELADLQEQAFFYEREPFVHPARPEDDPAAPAVTRFLALAAWGNAARAKALYAFALPMAGAPGAGAQLPTGCTPSPFLQRDANNKRRRAALEADPYSRFAQQGGDEVDANGRYHNKRHRRRDHQRPPPPGPDQCYFCLANPNLPTHMVCSIGTDAYLATAKGPLPASTTFAAEGLAFPGHMLIVTLSHAPTLAAAAAEAAAAGGGGGGGAGGASGAAATAGAANATYTEMTRFREGLQALVAAQSRGRLGAVTWEISRQRNVHVHWQTVPVPAGLVRQGLVAAAFRVEAAQLKLPALEDVKAADHGRHFVDDDDGGDFVRVWLWAPAEAAPGESEDTPSGAAAAAASANSRQPATLQILRMRLDDPHQRFDLQYARRVMAKLLGLEATRTVWQECVQTEAEETADVAAFRTAFAPWDFTLQE